MPDADDPSLDQDVDITYVEAGNFWPDHYIYVAIRLRGTSPVLANHSWWVYLDNGYPTSTRDGNNDWLVEERPGEVCTYAWDATNADWGVNGTGCDVSDTDTDTDIGSAVRIGPDCNFGVQYCVEFAIEKSDYPGLGQRPWVTAASSAVEDFNLLGNTDENPTNGVSSPCSDPAFDDCTWPVEIPEFSSLAIMVAVPAIIFAVSRRHGSRRGGRHHG